MEISVLVIFGDDAPISRQRSIRELHWGSPTATGGPLRSKFPAFIELTNDSFIPHLSEHALLEAVAWSIGIGVGAIMPCTATCLRVRY